jgi:hypothetical protein
MTRRFAGMRGHWRQTRQMAAAITPACHDVVHKS